jgi:ABC-type enterochelin transport system ATPase subunit
VISVSDLTKVYGMTVAVDHISFDVPQGQIVGFLGPNGAGKSTTLKILTCYLPPTSGGATIAGFNIFHQSEQVRQKLGYLPENCPLYTEMKVEEYLDFRGRLRGMQRDERRKRIDYLHMDIQGAELEFLASAPGVLREKVGRVLIGTHSTAIEEGLRRLFGGIGWRCQYDFPMNTELHIEGNVVTLGDGVQVWLNPAR